MHYKIIVSYVTSVIQYRLQINRWLIHTLYLLAYITSWPSWNEIEAEEIELNLTTIVCLIKTITRYDSLPTLTAKYTHARNVLTVTKRVERSRSIIIIKHKYMLMCNHKIPINLMRCLRNSTVRREIGQLLYFKCIICNYITNILST